MIHGQDNALYEEIEANQVYAYTRNQYCDPDGNTNDHKNDLSS